MIDLTKITTPFGLLDAETQEALRAHGGPYECFRQFGGRYDWGPTIGDMTADIYQAIAWRVKPAPPKPRECWSYGAHIRNTEAEAIEFRQRVADAHPGNGYELSPITKWIEVLP